MKSLIFLPFGAMRPSVIKTHLHPVPFIYKNRDNDIVIIDVIGF